MLINRGYTSGDVVCFKISNGDEIVAKLVEETADGIEKLREEIKAINDRIQEIAPRRDFSTYP